MLFVNTGVFEQQFVDRNVIIFSALQCSAQNRYLILGLYLCFQ